MEYENGLKYSKKKNFSFIFISPFEVISIREKRMFDAHEGTCMFMARRYYVSRSKNSRNTLMKC